MTGRTAGRGVAEDYTLGDIAFRITRHESGEIRRISVRFASGPAMLDDAAAFESDELTDLFACVQTARQIVAFHEGREPLPDLLRTLRDTPLNERRS